MRERSGFLKHPYRLVAAGALSGLAVAGTAGASPHQVSVHSEVVCAGLRIKPDGENTDRINIDVSSVDKVRGNARLNFILYYINGSVSFDGTNGPDTTISNEIVKSESNPTKSVEFLLQYPQNEANQATTGQVNIIAEDIYSVDGKVMPPVNEHYCNGGYGFGSPGPGPTPSVGSTN